MELNFLFYRVADYLKKKMQKTDRSFYSLLMLTDRIGRILMTSVSEIGKKLQCESGKVDDQYFSKA